MTRKQYILLFLFSIVNSFLIRVIPNHIFACGLVLLLGVLIFLAIIVMDILGKTKHWKAALYVLSLGIFSLVLGMSLFGVFYNRQN
jgi:hypothetical protein